MKLFYYQTYPFRVLQNTGNITYVICHLISTYFLAKKTKHHNYMEKMLSVRVCQFAMLWLKATQYVKTARKRPKFTDFLSPNIPPPHGCLEMHSPIIEVNFTDNFKYSHTKIVKLENKLKKNNEKSLYKKRAHLLIRTEKKVRNLGKMREGRWESRIL